MRAPREGPFGRCVCHSDHDVVDQMVIPMASENDVAAASQPPPKAVLSASALTYGRRRAAAGKLAA